MESLHDTQRDVYRLLITRRNASEILLSPNGPGWALPQAEIGAQQRVAEQLTAEIGRVRGIETYCLFVPSPRACAGDGQKAKYAVMESVRSNYKAPAGTYWMAPAVAASC